MRQPWHSSAIVVLLLTVSSFQATAIDNAELKQNVKWCIFHEGCGVYAGDVVRPIGELRNCYMAKEPMQPGTSGESVACTTTGKTTTQTPETF